MVLYSGKETNTQMQKHQYRSVDVLLYCSRYLLFALLPCPAACSVAWVLDLCGLCQQGSLIDGFPVGSKLCRVLEVGQRIGGREFQVFTLLSSLFGMTLSLDLRSSLLSRKPIWLSFSDNLSLPSSPKAGLGVVAALPLLAPSSCMSPHAAIV